MPREISVDTEFQCPECGSSWFSSHARTYYCGGSDRRRCSFQFPVDDMWKYFVQVTRVSFETPEEYERATRGERIDV